MRDRGIVAALPLHPEPFVRDEEELIIQWFGLEGSLNIIWFQPPCHGQRHLSLDQVAQSPN